MCSSGGEYLQILRDIAADDMDNGDYVTVDRIDHGFIIEEHILTFSGVTVKRGLLKYACNATITESEEDL